MTSVMETPELKSPGFKQFALNERLQRGIDAAGFAEPRPIQAATIPAGLEGRDVLGLAQTGTGKTAAFAVPILERLLSENTSGAPRIRALVLAPTRELARQIDDEIRVLARFTRIRTATVYGGVGMGPQMRNVARNPQIVVACPGRLLDLHNRGAIDLSGVETVVLDETDYMLDLGFLPNIRKILSLLPARRQNLMFSATMPTEIRKLADGMLHRPHVVELNNSQPAETIEHSVYPVHEHDKLALLELLLREDNFKSAIVFTRTKHRARRIAEKLTHMGNRAVALQGNMSQSQRDRAMRGFRDGDYDILVATDVAARGIDVAQVSHVVNFDVPTQPETYTHRIGRTGRAERQGKAFTFATVEDRDSVRDIERLLGNVIPRNYVEGMDRVELDTAPRQSRGGRGPGSARPLSPSQKRGGWSRQRRRR